MLIKLTSALAKQEKGNGKIKAIHFCKLLIKEMLAFMDLGMLMLLSYLKLEVTIKAAQARIGHKDIQTTMNVYTHVSNITKEKNSNNYSMNILIFNTKGIQSDFQH